VKVIEGEGAGKVRQARFTRASMPKQEVACELQTSEHGGGQYMKSAKHEGGPENFSMDYVDGSEPGRVQLRFAICDFAICRAARLMRQMAEVLLCPHARPQFPANLKPHNVSPTPRQSARVTGNFGLAKNREAGVSPGEFSGGSPAARGKAELRGGRRRTQARKPAYIHHPNRPSDGHAGVCRGAGGGDGKARSGSPANVFSGGVALLLPHLEARRSWPTVEGNIRKVQEVGAGRRRLINPACRDLETICHECRAKESSRRYAASPGTGVNLGRFLGRRANHARHIQPRGKDLALVWAKTCLTALVVTLL